MSQMQLSPDDSTVDTPVQVQMWHAQLRMHLCCLCAVASFHGYEALQNPASGHTVIATTFAMAMVRRATLHTHKPDLQARLDFARDCGYLALLCPFCTLAFGFTVPVSAAAFNGMALSYAVVNCLLLMTGFPRSAKLMLLLGHAAMALAVEPDLLQSRITSTCILLGSMGMGVAVALMLDQALLQLNGRVREVPEAHDGTGSTHASSSNANLTDAGRPSSLPQREHLFRMVEGLRTHTAQLLDVREDHETSQGVLRCAYKLPLSRLCDGSAPLPLGLDAQRLTYIYCARGVRVHPAADMLKRFGFPAERLMPLSEGYETLAAFGKEVGSSLLAIYGSHTISTAASDDLSEISSFGAEQACSLSESLDAGFVGGRVSSLADYSVEETLGYGTFAHVVLLKHRTSGELVVSKQMAVSGLTAREKRQLANEVAVQASLHHPYVVRLSGFYEGQGHLSMLMQYAPGGALHAYLERLASKGKRLNTDLFLRPWISQIATALQYVHSRHVLHRDLSSQNIFLDDEGNALIGDFGLSFRLLGGSMASASLPSRSGSTTPWSALNVGGSQHGATAYGRAAPQTQCGTPTYMSPELISGAAYGKASDVWAFGILIVEMIALCLPFSAPSLGGIVSAITAGTWHPAARKAFEASAAPPEFKALVSDEALLHPDPAKRMVLSEVLQRFPLLDPLAPDGGERTGGAGGAGSRDVVA